MNNAQVIVPNSMELSYPYTCTVPSFVTKNNSVQYIKFNYFNIDFEYLSLCHSGRHSPLHRVQVHATLLFTVNCSNSNGKYTRNNGKTYESKSKYFPQVLHFDTNDRRKNSLLFYKISRQDVNKQNSNIKSKKVVMLKKNGNTQSKRVEHRRQNLCDL